MLNSAAALTLFSHDLSFVLFVSPLFRKPVTDPGLETDAIREKGSGLTILNP